MISCRRGPLAGGQRAPLKTSNYHATIAIDETPFEVEASEVYVRAAVDRETFQVVHIEVSPGGSALDTVLFTMREVER